MFIAQEAVKVVMALQFSTTILFGFIFETNRPKREKQRENLCIFKLQLFYFVSFFYRHTPTNYLVDAAAAAAAGKSMRGTPQGTPIGLPASVSGLTIGRSSSPASRTPASMYQPGGLNQRVLSSADPAGQAARYNLHAAAAAAAANPAALMGIRGDPAAYLRGNVSMMILARKFKLD